MSKAELLLLLQQFEFPIAGAEHFLFNLKQQPQHASVASV
jgi:hypothetical protein